MSNVWGRLKFVGVIADFLVRNESRFLSHIAPGVLWYGACNISIRIHKTQLVTEEYLNIISTVKNYKFLYN